MRASLLPVVFLTSLVVAPFARADVNLTPDVPEGVRPPALFSNGMILQREMTVPIFGKASVGEEVTVTFNGQEKTTTTGGDGRWQVDLDPMVAGGPFVMTIEGNNTITITDVRIGEVWVCAGQSNMTRKRIRRTTLALNPSIRALVRSGWNDQPGLVPYTIAQNLQNDLGGIPIGILNLAAGGTNAVNWVGQTAASDPNPNVPQYLIGDWGYLHAKFVKPLHPFRIRGVFWWQGEADSRRPEVHRALYPAVIRSWRNEWGIGDFPWISMQVPTGRGLVYGELADPLPVNASATDTDAFIRQTYVRALAEFPYTSFASSIDLVGGIHPRDSVGYAQRMSDQALALVYGQTFAYAGPLYASMTVEGSTLRIHYRENTADGLSTWDGLPIQGFAITGDGVTWHWADVAVDGNEILLSSASVPNPVRARYAWANRPLWANLVNAAGYGASAFDTEVTPGEYGP